jgi:hypothetical protein
MGIRPIRDIVFLPDPAPDKIAEPNRACSAAALA